MIVTVMAKRTIRNTIKVVSTSAGLVFLFVLPNGFNQLLLFIGSIVVLLVCFVLWTLLFGDEHTGWWPDKPEQ